MARSLGELKSFVFVLLRRGLGKCVWMLTVIPMVYGEQKQLNSRKELESFQVQAVSFLRHAGCLCLFEVSCKLLGRCGPRGRRHDHSEDALFWWP